MRRNIRIAPSLLSADFSCLLKQIRLIEQTDVEILHLDIMDGHFVKNITFGPHVVADLRPHTKLYFDVHLMITHPEEYIDRFAQAGADIITFHLETVTSPEVILHRIHKLNKQTGVSIKPATPVANVYKYLSTVSQVLIMTVEPGFSGQKLIPSTLRKVTALRRYIDREGLTCAIEVDGGVNEETMRSVVSAGADILVCGNAIFKAKSITRKIRFLTKMAKENSF